MPSRWSRASLASGTHGLRVPEPLGAEIGIDMAQHWRRPTAENFFDRIKKAQILAQARRADPALRYGGARRANWRNLRLACATDTIIEPESRRRAWVPDAMRFDDRKARSIEAFDEEMMSIPAMMVTRIRPTRTMDGGSEAA
jgi:ParB family chromosome partitioning protein